MQDDDNRQPARWILPVAVLAVCAASVTFTFWLFTTSGKAFFGEEPVRLVTFEVPEELPRQREADGSLRMVHFWDPDCPCEPANRIHLETLVRNWSSRELTLEVVPIAGARRPEEFRAGVLNRAQWSEEGPFNRVEVPASPSVAVYDREGTLRYFGPYSTGGFCSPDGSGLVEPVLRALDAGEPVHREALSVLGCYCKTDPR